MDASQQPPADETQPGADPTDLHASSTAPSEDLGGSSPEPEASVEDMDLAEELKANLVGEPAPEDEPPPRRYEENEATKPRTSAQPPPYPIGDEPQGFFRPDGALPAAVRSAERVVDRDPSAKAEERRETRAAE